MTSNIINLCGITPKHCFPECLPDFFTQFCETDQLYILGKDPDIQEILGVSLTISIRDFRILCTSLEKKLIVHGVKHIEIVFKNCGIKYVSKFYIPFCTFILLDDMDKKVTDVRVIVEDLNAFQMSARCVAISSLLLIFPDFKQGNDEWHDANTIRCDIKLKSC